MAEIIVPRKFIEDAKADAAKLRATFSPIKKGEIAEQFLMNLMYAVESLVIREEVRCGVHDGK